MKTHALATLSCTLLLSVSGVAQTPIPDPELPSRINPQTRPDQINTLPSAATTTSMDKLDSKRELLIGDVLSFRIIEDEEPVTRIVVTDSGEIDVPYIGLVSAKGKTCKILAGEIKKLLEKDYYHKTTKIYTTKK